MIAKPLTRSIPIPMRHAQVGEAEEDSKQVRDQSTALGS